MANQYLALVMPFACWFPNVFCVAYMITAGLLLVVSGSGLHVASPVPESWLYSAGFQILVILVLSGLVWETAASRIGAALRPAIERLLGGLWKRAAHRRDPGSGTGGMS
jgi:hypothetical protein